MAAETGIIRYVITGEESRADIPRNVTHVSVHPTVKVISRRLFYQHRNIVELICHDGVIIIENEAFYGCPRLKRVIMNGVEEVEGRAFDCCEALECVECDKLEGIGQAAFSSYNSMTSFNLPSAKIVLRNAFRGCEKLKYVKFGKKLETVEENVFYDCRSLERITIPLKNGLFDYDNTFQSCGNLRHVDFVEGAVLQDTIDALLCDKWRNEINAEIDSINQILPHAYAGDYDAFYDHYIDAYGDDPGTKAQVVRNWIAGVLRKIVHYKAEHLRVLRYSTSILQHALPQDIVMNTVMPFLKLPQHKFDGESEGDEEGELGMNSNDEDVDESHTSRLDNEEEDTDEGSVGGDVDESNEEAFEVVTGDGERRMRRKAKTDNLDGEDERDQCCLIL